MAILKSEGGQSKNNVAFDITKRSPGCVPTFGDNTALATSEEFVSRGRMLSSTRPLPESLSCSSVGSLRQSGPPDLRGERCGLERSTPGAYGLLAKMRLAAPAANCHGMC